MGMFDQMLWKDYAFVDYVAKACNGALKYSVERGGKTPGNLLQVPQSISDITHLVLTANDLLAIAVFRGFVARLQDIAS